MMRFALAALLVASSLSLLALPACAADPVEGVWRTLPDDNGNYGLVHIAPCGAKLCGTLVRAYDGSGKPVESPHVGRQIVWDMVAEGGGQYGDGRIWAPDRDKTYRSKMVLSGDRLSVSGCVLGGLICRASEWTRAR